MEKQSNIWYVTLLLSLVAGYCDTVTFVAADSIFSAHVTGNFIVFAYQLVKGSELHAWIKLLTFPVFILSVIIGGRLGAGETNRYKLLFAEGLLLVFTGLLTYLFGYLGIFDEWTMYIVALIVVFAMGLQNAFGKLYAKETHGPTTMMTGNVTQASLDLGNLIKTGFGDLPASESLKRQTVTISGFLAGCFLGAVAGKFWGLGTVLLPGIVLIFCYLKSRAKA